MKKRAKPLFLYRYRLIIGYILLATAFFALLAYLPHIAPGGLSSDEMDSVSFSDTLDRNLVQKGSVVDLPYHMLQKLSISIFGLSLFSIKLPSIIIAVVTGLFIILLLNRWFKNDVAILGSILTTLSTAFLFIASNGTPLISYIFWLALILWLGSKIVGNNHVHPLLVVSFFISIALSSYTPHLLYISIGIAVAGILHPHLRFALKQLKKYQLILCILIFALAISPLLIGCFNDSSNIQDLLFTRKLSFESFINNISTAFAPFFSFSLAYDSVFLAPLFGLGTVALIIIGILASIGKLFTSRNTIINLLVIFSIVVSGINPDVAIVIIIPIAILSAAGLESIIEKWYSLFPENPYAHITGIIPLVIVLSMIVSSGITHFIFGYHYVPRVADNFNKDLIIIQENIDKETPILISNVENQEFYRLLGKYENYKIIDTLTDEDEFVSFGAHEDKNYAIKQIITSPKSRNSDRLYIYSKKTDKQGE